MTKKTVKKQTKKTIKKVVTQQPVEKTKEKEKLKSILINDQLHLKLKRHCSNNGLQMKAFVERSIKKSLVTTKKK